MTTPHWANGRFFNPHCPQDRRGPWQVLRWLSGRYNEPVERIRAPEAFVMPQMPPVEGEPSYSVQWVNHSTFLVQGEGVALLTDPIWSEYASFMPRCGPRRRIPPGRTLESLPRLDLVLISHDHYDHLDKPTIKALLRSQPQVTFCAPLGVAAWLRRRGAQQVIELDWWESAKSGKLAITAVPAQHFSGRSLHNRNSTLWCGWVVTLPSGKRVYFVGDSGYNAIDFKQVKERFGPMDLCLIPIGAYLPRCFMQPVHMSPEEALRVHLDVGSKRSIGGHFGTFKLTQEEAGRPAYDLYQAMLQQGVPYEQFRVPSPGEIVAW